MGVGGGGGQAAKEPVAVNAVNSPKQSAYSLTRGFGYFLPAFSTQ